MPATSAIRRSVTLAVLLLALGLAASAQRTDAAPPSPRKAERAGTKVAARAARSVRRAKTGVRAVRRAAIAQPAPPVLQEAPPALTTATTALFRFSSANRSASFTCALDGAAARRCSSPARYSGLAPGRHSLSLRAIVRGRTSTATVHTWTITTASPPAPAPAPAPAPTPTPAPAPAPSPPAPAPAPGVATRIATPPRAPSAYTVPAGAVRVRTGAELAQALAATTPRDIVLADGVYEHHTFFENVYGHRLYAEHLGGAVLHAGLVFGHNWGLGGGLVQGVSIDVGDPARTLQSSLVHVWGLARGTRILDVTLDGHGVLQSGIDVRQANGVVVQRVVARRFSGYGVRVDANVLDLVLDQPALIEDVEVSSVSRAVPMSSNGTAEACVWVGNTATVRRVRTRDCAWMGVWSGTASHHSLFEDIDIDRTASGVGMYAEHFSRSSTYQRLHVGPNIIRGMICEWADPAWGSLPACVDTVVQDSLFDTTCAGVVLDEGTTRTTVRRTRFVHQSWAAIDDFRGNGNLWDVSGNDYSGIAAGAAAVSRGHHGTACPNPQEQLGRS